MACSTVSGASQPGALIYVMKDSDNYRIRSCDAHQPAPVGIAAMLFSHLLPLAPDVTHRDQKTRERESELSMPLLEP